MEADMASISRYDPLDLLEGMMKSVIRPSYESASQQRGNGGAWQAGGGIPIDVAENDKAYILWADLPGVKKEHVNVSILGNQLSLTAEFKRESAVDQGQGKESLLASERPTGTAYRQLQFGADIDDTKAQAEFRDGVLQLTLPKKESAQVKRITIQ
jgi:HSP20 family protein